MSKFEEKKKEEVVIERPYTLRALKDSDLFPILQILRKVGVAKFKDSLSQMTAGKSVEEIGLMVVADIAGTILDNIDKVEEDINKLLSDTSGLTVDAIGEMEFGTRPLMLYDLFGTVKDTTFFKVVFKLL